jgi:hypothetical protein
VERPAATVVNELLDEALLCFFVADPLSPDRLAAYSEILVPARARAFGMLAAIGRQYPDLDMTVDRAPTSADIEFDDDLTQQARRAGKSKMRLALERARGLLQRAAGVAGAGSSASEGAFFLEYCGEAQAAINAGLAYLSTVGEP